jgi:hypothetical protein
MVPVAKFPGAYVFFGGLCFCGGTVFIGTTDIKGFIAPKPAKPGKDVGGQNLNKIPQMGYIVHIG